MHRERTTDIRLHARLTFFFFHQSCTFHFALSVSFSFALFFCLCFVPISWPFITFIVFATNHIRTTSRKPMHSRQKCSSIVIWYPLDRDPYFWNRYFEHINSKILNYIQNTHKQNPWYRLAFFDCHQIVFNSNFNEDSKNILFFLTILQ